MIQACENAGYLNKDCEAIGCTMVQFARAKKATKVVAYLQQNGDT